MLVASSIYSYSHICVVLSYTHANQTQYNSLWIRNTSQGANAADPYFYKPKFGQTRGTGTHSSLLSPTVCSTMVFGALDVLGVRNTDNDIETKIGIELYGWHVKLKKKKDIQFHSQAISHVVQSKRNASCCVFTFLSDGLHLCSSRIPELTGSSIVKIPNRKCTSYL